MRLQVIFTLLLIGVISVPITEENNNILNKATAESLPTVTVDEKERLQTQTISKKLLITTDADQKILSQTSTKSLPKYSDSNFVGRDWGKDAYLGCWYGSIYGQSESDCIRDVKYEHPDATNHRWVQRDEYGYCFAHYGNQGSWYGDIPKTEHVDTCLTIGVLESMPDEQFQWGTSLQGKGKIFVGGFFNQYECAHAVVSNFPSAEGVLHKRFYDSRGDDESAMMDGECYAIFEVIDGISASGGPYVFQRLYQKNYLTEGYYEDGQTRPRVKPATSFRQWNREDNIVWKARREQAYPGRILPDKAYRDNDWGRYDSNLFVISGIGIDPKGLSCDYDSKIAMFKNYALNNKDTSDLVQFQYNPTTGFTDILFWTIRSVWHCKDSWGTGTRYPSNNEIHRDGYGYDDPCDQSKFTPATDYHFERRHQKPRYLQLLDNGKQIYHNWAICNPDQPIADTKLVVKVVPC